MTEVEVKAIDELQKIVAEMMALFQAELAEKNQALLDAEKKLYHQQCLTIEANEYIRFLEQQRVS